MMPNPTPEDNQQARDFLHQNLTPDVYGIEAAVSNALADAYAAGRMAAASQLQNTVSTASLTSETPDDYWSRWKPGDIEASDLLKDGGFQKLLKKSKVTIQGVSDTTLDQMGTALSEGAARGDSVDVIARAMRAVADSASRAYQIANTELNRAVTESALQAYSEMSVAKWDWLVSDGACPLCEEMAANGPYDVGDDGDQPPAHPGCRCAASPHIDEGVKVAADDSEALD